MLKDVEEKRDIMRYIIMKKTKLIGYLFRYNTFIRNIFDGKNSGRTRESPRSSCFQNFKQFMEVTVKERGKRQRCMAIMTRRSPQMVMTKSETSSISESEV